MTFASRQDAGCRLGHRLHDRGVLADTVVGLPRGGVVVAVHEAIDVPVKFVGVGENAEDLIAFDPIAFVDSLLDIER